MDFDTNKVTLMFLANSVYQEEVEREEPNLAKERKKEEKFYRKRVFAMMKDMLRGKYPSDELRRAHQSYVHSLINYIKVQDRVDLIQKDYPPKSIDESSDKQNTLIEDSLISANALLMTNLPVNDKGTLDDFVEVKKCKVTKDVIPPRRKDLNIKTDDHRTKGLKERKKKKKNKSKSDSCQTK
jgi:hypothetical protein